MLSDLQEWCNGLHHWKRWCTQSLRQSTRHGRALRLLVRLHANQCIIGQFFGEFVQILIRWLSINLCDLILIQSLFNIVTNTHVSVIPCYWKDLVTTAIQWQVCWLLTKVVTKFMSYLFCNHLACKLWKTVYSIFWILGTKN
jgi:hypothetical protein